MDVAILGASGDCGREIAARLIESRLLAPTERMQLVGRENGPSAQVLYGLVSDLADAHAEYVPDLDVALRPDEVVADVWVVSCGKTAPTGGQTLNRAALGSNNAPVFAEYARALARNGQGTEIVVVVSNPVELAVAIFAEAIGSKRVIGIGAYQDTLRFRREIAADLGVRRQRIGGFMVGEHGANMVPVWSSVSVHGVEPAETADVVRGLRKGTETVPFAELYREMQGEIAELVPRGEIAEAYRRLEVLPPDARALLKPYLTHLSGAKTVGATANVTVDVLQTILDGREMLIAGQVMLQRGDFYDLTGPLGVPIIAGPSGVVDVVQIPLTNAEQANVAQASQHVGAQVQAWMQEERSA